MPDVSDMELLRDYERQGSEEAFAALVRRHINLVYSAAFRHVGIVAHAEEITQAVFVILARKAAGLRPDTILEGWLYETTRLISLSFVRGERRRQLREQQAYMQSTLQESADVSAWNQLAPLLDEAMARLGKKDREAVVLRFFKEKSLGEVAAAMNVTEAAAQSRVHRAVEKLRRFFTKRGVVIPAAVLTTAISANSVQAAPAVLAKSVTTVAIAKGAAASGSALTLIQGALKIMAWTKAKTAIVAGAVVLLAAGTAIITVKEIRTRQTYANIAGAWEGTLSVPAMQQKVHLVLKIARANGTYAATLDSIDQGVKGIQASKLDVDKETIRVAFAGLKAEFVAGIDPGVTRLSGNWQQGTMRVPLVFTRTAKPDIITASLAEADYTPRPGSDIQGLWRATLTSGQMSLRLNLKIAELADGLVRAELQSADQSSLWTPASSVTYNGSHLKMDFAGLGGVFEGEINTSAGQITGDWKQRGKQVPAIFRRVDLKAEQAAENAKDYTYAIASDLQGHWKGTLDAPKAKLRLVLHIARMPDGSFSGAVDSLDQGVNGIPADTVQFTSPNVHMEWNSMKVIYDARLENGKLSGTWRAGTTAFPLAFERNGAN
jgi:RNA polymerase sigma factor (sigma-70 family)